MSTNYSFTVRAYKFLLQPVVYALSVKLVFARQSLHHLSCLEIVNANSTRLAVISLLGEETDKAELLKFGDDLVESFNFLTLVSLLDTFLEEKSDFIHKDGRSFN